MNREATGVRKVICLAPLPDGRTISLAQFDDARLGIYLDAEVISASMWDHDQLDECINVYLGLIRFRIGPRAPGCKALYST